MLQYILYWKSIGKYEQVLKKEWTNNGLLKWWHYVCHINKICMWIQKVWHNSVKTKIKIYSHIEWGVKVKWIENLLIQEILKF